MAFVWFNTLRKYLGWCPEVRARVRKAEAVLEDETVAPSGSGSFRDRAIHWLGLFRNQTVLQAIGTFCAGFYLFAGLGGVSRPDLFLSGLLAGLLVSAIIGLLYWRIFHEVLSEGPVVLLTRFDTASAIFATLTLVGILYWQVCFLTGPVPWFDTTATNAFFGGFIATLFFGLLVSVWKWESDTHRQLQYDGMILMLEKD
jgi:hypothetical protein